MKCQKNINYDVRKTTFNRVWMIKKSWSVTKYNFSPIIKLLKAIAKQRALLFTNLSLRFLKDYVI